MRPCLFLIGCRLCLETFCLHSGYCRTCLHPHRGRPAAALPGTTLFTSTREDPLYFTWDHATSQGQAGRAQKNKKGNDNNNNSNSNNNSTGVHCHHIIFQHHVRDIIATAVSVAFVYFLIVIVNGASFVVSACKHAFAGRHVRSRD